MDLTYKIVNSKVENIVSYENGSVCLLEKEGNIRVTSSSFVSCKAISPYSAGAVIYSVMNKGSLTMSKTCASQCYAWNGIIVYAIIVSDKNIDVSYTTAMKCNASERSTFYLYGDNVFVNNYNASYNSIDIESDLRITQTTQMSVSYFNFYSNVNDIMIVVHAGVNDRRISNGNFINNDISLGEWGLIHYNLDKATLYVSDSVFYGNKNYLFDCWFGTLVAERIECDVLTHKPDHKSITAISIKTISGIEFDTNKLRKLNNCNTKVVCTIKRIVRNQISYACSIIICILIS